MMGWFKAFAVRLSRLDAKSAASLAFLVVFAALVVAATRYGGEIFKLEDKDDLLALVDQLGASKWSTPAMLTVFLIGGVTGLLPQFLMISVAVVLFGAWGGFAVSWIGTMISSTLGFLLGKTVGSGLLKRFGGGRANRLSEKLGEHGIASTIVLRLVPSAPFIVVNMAAGASHISLIKFWLGSAVGTLPKMVFIAIAGSRLLDFIAKPNLGGLIAIVAVVALWIAGGLWVRARIKRWQGERSEPDVPQMSESPPDSRPLEPPLPSNDGGKAYMLAVGAGEEAPGGTGRGRRR